MVQTTQDQIFNITLNHNHLTITETEIAQGDRSHEKDFVMLEITLILY